MSASTPDLRRRFPSPEAAGFSRPDRERSEPANEEVES